MLRSVISSSIHNAVKFVNIRMVESNFEIWEAIKENYHPFDGCLAMYMIPR